MSRKINKRKHLIFKIIGRKPKTNVYQVLSNDGIVLGSIYWYGKWRQYIFEPDMLITCVFSSSCLLEIVQFIKNIKRKK